MERDKNPSETCKAAIGRLDPPPEEDLGGGDICSLEDNPSTEDNKPLIPMAVVELAKESDVEDDHPRRSLGAVAIALTVAIVGAVALLIVDHGLGKQPYVESARARAATEAAAEADGAIVTPTRKPSLYSRIVRRLR